MKLSMKTLAWPIFGIALFGLTLFVPAGTVNYWQAWVFIAVFTAASSVPTAYLAMHDPDALRRRMHAGPTAETRPQQRFVVTALMLASAAQFVVSALDHRFGWSHVPNVAVILGNVLVFAGLLSSQYVIVQNTWAAATLTVEEGQQLVSTGLYGVVRHPMYLGALVMMVGTPPALDSFYGLLVVVPALALLTVRIRDEEKMLREELPGYAEYTHRVRSRLIPRVW
jgi:protein-S-isoprenylcysteine O-methyltransferase Ste14